MKMCPEQVQRAATAVQAVKRIDDTIEWLGRDVEANAGHWGEKIRHIFGQNRLSQLRSDHLGEIVFCAIVNALLQEREATIQDFSEAVEFPEPPCPEQRPAPDSEPR